MKQSSISTKRSYPGIDFVKLIMALLVVEIHVKPLSVLGSDFLERFVTSVDCIAVPFFFIASGFLCFCRIDSCNVAHRTNYTLERVRGTAFHLLRTYLLWTIIYIPLSVLGFMLQGKPPIRALLLFLRGVILIGQNSYSWQLWYLLAAFVGFALVYFFLREGVAPNAILGISFAFLLCGYLMIYLKESKGTPEFLLRLIVLYFRLFDTIRNGLFEGFFYIALGMMLGLDSNIIDCMTNLQCLLMISFGIAGSFLVSPDAHLPFCASSALAVFVISAKARPSVGCWGLKVRSLSTTIYLIHMILVVVYAYGICGYRRANLMQASLPRIKMYFFVIGMSVLLHLLYELVDSKLHKSQY